MLYTYTYYTHDTVNNCTKRLEVTTNLAEIKIQDVTAPYHVEVYDNMTNEVVTQLLSEDDLDAWQTSQERAHAWRSPKRTEVPLKENSATKPKHYESYIDEYQWIDAMSRIHRFENPEVFKGALELQIRKYLDRNGKKDEEAQELTKGLFYYIYMLMYISNGNSPILANNVHKLIKLIQDETRI
jgi:hypothetical protein